MPLARSRDRSHASPDLRIADERCRHSVDRPLNDTGATEPPWDTIVRADSRSELSLRELWAYRDLVLLLIHRDFTAQYKQTLLGPLWHVINPLLATAAFSVVFGGIAGLSTDNRPR